MRIAHNRKATPFMRQQIIELGLEKKHYIRIAKIISEEHKIEITPNHVSNILAQARASGLRIPYPVQKRRAVYFK